MRSSDVTTKSDGPAPKPAPKRPYHVGVAVGLTTGVYAVSLLGASRIQFETDRELIADRTPVERAIEVLGDHHDGLGERLDAARDAYAAGAAGYDAMTERLADLDRHLLTLDETVIAVERLAASISTRLALPDVPRPRAGTATGGGSGGSSAGGGATTTTVKPPKAAPPPPAAAPPPANATTGGSGAP
jgi:hypothetical protein